MRVDVCNETDSAERLHWHGQETAAVCDVPAYSMRRMEFTPTRTGLYFYHSHLIAAANLGTGLYSGQAGGLLVEGRTRPYHEREWIVVLKECEPFVRRTRRGCEIAYRSLTLNGRLPGHGTAVRINSGERVLLHVLNASATEPRSLELPGHTFDVVALDGNPVPSPSRVRALQVSPGERVSAIVEASVDLHAPVDWVVGDPGTGGWDYMRFGSAPGTAVDSGAAGMPDTALEMVLTRHDAARSGFNSWSINGASFSAVEPRPLFHLRCGLRYRLTIRNTSDEILPLHLQRHRLEIVSVDGIASAGILKDVVTVGPRQQLQVEFVADNRGPALFYCTRQLHRDFGLMALIHS